jgi:hypothetical protein
VRDNYAASQRREATKLVQMEKYIIELLATNKHSLQDEGISHIVVTGAISTEVDENDYGLNNWYVLRVNVLLVYRLRKET